MGNKFNGEGNLGITPELKRLEKDNDDQAVCNLRIYFDRPVPKQDDEGFEDKGGFWMNVEIWGKRGIRCYEMLAKGNRVTVDGSIIGKKWNDRESGEEQFSLVVRAKRVNPDLMTVDSIKQK
ncbi:MAG: single-stranded DNA-binding protein [Gammaproteobacteria bacterium]|jgi:single-strand DNA-binding protein|nr:single-stranded DNA-binding protein [Gammaproteobacteria bacterium]